MNIVEPSFLQEEIDNDNHQDIEMGGYLEAEFPSLPDADGVAVFVNQSQEDFYTNCFSNALHYQLEIIPMMMAGPSPRRGIPMRHY